MLAACGAAQDGGDWIPDWRGLGYGVHRIYRAVLKPDDEL